MRSWAETLLVVAGTALATALAVTCVLATAPAVANEGQQQEIQWPTLKEGGVEITLRAQQNAYKAGEQPVAELELHNPSGATVTVQAKVQLLRMETPNRMSRIALPYRKTWETERTLMVKAGERQRVVIPTGTAISNGAQVMLSLQVGKQTVMTRPISAPTPVEHLAQTLPRQAAATQ